MANLSTTYMGLKVNSPLIIGSSGLTNSIENIEKFAKLGAGAIILKSLFEEQIMHEASFVLKQDLSSNYYPEAEDYILNYTKQNSIQLYLELIKEAKKKVDIPIIASINCTSASEWTTFAKSIEAAGADGLELNIFVMPSDLNRNSEENEKIYFDIVNKVKQETSLPISVKLSYHFSSLASMLEKLSWTGIKSLTLFNRFFSPDIDIEKMDVKPSFVFSKAEDIGISLRWVAMLSNRLRCELSASTGVHNGEAVIKQLLAGAQTVQIASVLYKSGIDSVSEILNDINIWMDKKGFADIEAFRGKLSIDKATNPGAYERVQFMKHFAGIE
ncbi:MAG: dihydroorotate dehydrogenase-like protein [Bacteroidales bacterium]|nr:dihydroorotate dehydrogenase-like protein [Bacteroidales bacterium]RLD38991.1 MAG: diguanylate cyclase [Bacteroidota bacterium]